jgi:alkanesulfonate monooxygenase SsuD/methylene tetrahydromethanopterin reductase-like flavin-dependent oxidoreductase (luciferase family)
VTPAPAQRGGPPLWIAAMRPRAIALAARCADGWEASFLAPAAFREAAARLDTALVAAGRPRGAVRRSVEVDAALVHAPAQATAAIERFCRRRSLAREHPLLEAALVGDTDSVVTRARGYGAAGATDLMVGFEDFPETAMLERFAARVLPALSARVA